MAPSTVAGLRERNRISTRNELARFGIELFLEQGFANTTIDQIVEPLGIARRTFFRYFQVKEDLVFAWYEERTPELVRELASRPRTEGPYEAVCEALSILLKLYDADPQWARSMMRLSMETPSLVGKSFEKKDLWEKELAAALIEREGRRAMSALRARVIVGTAMTAFSAAVAEWFQAGGKTKLRPIVQRAFSMARAL